MFYVNDSLWGGERCASTSSCCEVNSPPWFCKSLPQPTTDDQEIRLCNHYRSIHADKIVTVVNINVKYNLKISLNFHLHFCYCMYSSPVLCS